MVAAPTCLGARALVLSYIFEMISAVAGALICSLSGERTSLMCNVCKRAISLR